MTGRSKKMPISPEARQRLRDLIDHRRLELRLRWQDVATAGGISLKALHSVRTGNAGIAAPTRGGIEDGLRWQSGSVDSILEGGDPTPLGSRAGSGVPAIDEALAT